MQPRIKRVNSHQEMILVQPVIPTRRLRSRGLGIKSLKRRKNRVNNLRSNLQRLPIKISGNKLLLILTRLRIKSLTKLMAIKIVVNSMLIRLPEGMLVSQTPNKYWITLSMISLLVRISRSILKIRQITFKSINKIIHQASN